MDFKDKVAVVTGSSRGIGRAIATQFGACGAKVAVNYRSNKDASEEVAAEIRDSGGEAMVVHADVSSREDCTKLIDQVIEKWETIHFLVNNAGVTRDGLVMGLNEPDLDAVIKTNLEATVLLSKLAVPHMMMQRFGRIINISSVSADNGRKGQAIYSASKGAVESFTKVLALEVAAKGITVNALAPGMIESDMTDFVRGMASKEILAQIPLKRFGKPQDIASCVLFLASEQANYITGQTIKIDGGLTLGIGV